MRRLICILLAVSLFPAISESALITVPTGGSIQKAIGEANDGDIVEVTGGTYFENLVVNRSVRLRGIDGPLIDGRRKTGYATVLISAPGAILEGFVITNSSTSGVNVTADDVIVKDCTAKNNFRFGLTVFNADNVSLQNVTAIYTGDPGYSYYGKGILLLGASNTTLEGLEASRNNVSGVQLERSSNIALRTGSIHSNGQYGLYLTYSSSITVSGFSIEARGTIDDSGCWALNAQNLTIESSTIAGYHGRGLYLQNVTGAVLRDNTIANDTYTQSRAIHLLNAEGVEILGNVVNVSGWGLIIEGSGLREQNRIYLNSFLGNAGRVTSSGSMQIMNSLPLEYGYRGSVHRGPLGNYWEKHEATDMDGDGVLDIPYISGDLVDSYPLATLHTSYVIPPPDTTPPASVTNLTNTTYLPDSIQWVWEDPADTDFSHVEVYLDGTFMTDVPEGTMGFLAEQLSAGREYTIATRTVDANGNVNATWVNHTATTSSGEPEPAVVHVTGERHGAVDSIPPSCPVGLDVGETRSPTILLEWTDPEDPDLSQLILELDGRACAVIPRGFGRWRVLDLEAARRYRVCLFPIDLAGNMNRSCDCIEVTIPAETTPPLNGSQAAPEREGVIPATPLQVNPTVSSAPDDKISTGGEMPGIPSEAAVEETGHPKNEESDGGSGNMPRDILHLLTGISLAAGAGYLLLRRWGL